VRVPADISMVGFVDIAWAKYLHPTLTTMHNPIGKMARRAATLALQLNAGIVGPPQNNCYCAELIPRASVRHL
ncbi:substrate-binding domain-containing protein, partial [Candidatus Symbiopectobacterium sp. NZEC135]|uniref:substrate-binding domain-containing protein n=1 Tax=Candidatus Symbiopectobacterium sp. NZEC135 TaxID=2820471 RepID=UPI0022262CD9